jgi:hypothetical protein
MPNTLTLNNNIPKIGISLLREFMLYLADYEIRNKVKRRELEKKQNNTNNHNVLGKGIPNSYQWIETLLQTPISDHRKYTMVTFSLSPMRTLQIRLPCPSDSLPAKRR